MEDVKDPLTQPASTASRREPARRWHAADGLSLGAVGEARQGRDPARRNSGKNQSRHSPTPQLARILWDFAFLCWANPMTLWLSELRILLHCSSILNTQCQPFDLRPVTWAFAERVAHSIGC